MFISIFIISLIAEQYKGEVKNIKYFMFKCKMGPWL